MTPASEHYTLAADEAEAIWFIGTLATIKAAGARTGGALSIVEFTHPPGFATPRHVHHAEDEAFYVLEGTFGFQLGEETVEASTGAFVFAPKGIVHAFWNQGPTPARMLVMMSPPEFWRYGKELAEGLAAVGDDAEAATSLRESLSEKYDVEVVGPPRRGVS